MIGGMQNSNAQLLSLPALAEALKLPEGWLKAEADAGRIPHLRISKRYRFNRIDRVQHARTAPNVGAFGIIHRCVIRSDRVIPLTRSLRSRMPPVRLKKVGHRQW